jgi:hypothetical protein
MFQVGVNKILILKKRFQSIQLLDKQVSFSLIMKNLKIEPIQITFQKIIQH